MRVLASTVALVALVALVAASSPSAAQSPDPKVEAVVREALARDVAVPAQVRALVDLAWTKPDADPEVRALARKTLGEFGQHALPGLAAAVGRVEKAQTEEVVRVLLDAASRVPTGTPPELLQGLREALWSGSAGARRVAIPALARQRDRFGMLFLIDCAEEDADLLPVVVPALGEIGDDRARFFLAKILAGGKTGLMEQAAVALARIGGRALEPLREALRSSNQALRLTAARAILPVSTEHDLSAIYEYLAAFPTDDAATVAALKAACETIEANLEARRAAEAASAPQDF